MKIGVFCSANSQINPEYFRQTEALGRWMGENGHTLVFGGCNMGLMECVAKAAHEAGAQVIGIVPTKIEEGGMTSDSCDTVVYCSDLTDRKELLLEKSDLIVALPGGIGTLDEVFTVAASHTIGYHQKPLILFNIEGFWNPLTALMDALQAQGMIRGRWNEYLQVANTLEELKEMI